jgi:Na+/H+-dicarboxylate symporter
MAMVLNAVGLLLEGLGIILAVDRILDMFRTATNVAGDGAVTIIVAETFRGDEDLPET